MSAPNQLDSAEKSNPAESMRILLICHQAEMLNRVADAYDDNVENAIAGLATVGAHLDATVTTYGLVLILCAAFCWACANVVVKVAARRAGGFGMTFAAHATTRASKRGSKLRIGAGAHA